MQKKTKKQKNKYLQTLGSRLAGNLTTVTDAWAISWSLDPQQRHHTSSHQVLGVRFLSKP